MNSAHTIIPCRLFQQASDLLPLALEDALTHGILSGAISIPKAAPPSVAGGTRSHLRRLQPRRYGRVLPPDRIVLKTLLFYGGCK